ncbi:MAG: hypothetical protein ABSA68_07720 [Xanthobacteraceae bacterium]|jgi:hypothetical protein
MTIFSDLQTKLDEWLQAQDDYQRRSITFMVEFATAFRSYIDAPETYIDFQTKQSLWYVQPVMAGADKDGIYSFEIAPSAEDLLLKDDEGYWITALQFTIDRQPAALKKLYFWYLIRFVLRHDFCEMHIGFDKKQFRFRPNEIATQHTAFHYMVTLVNDVFALKPWEAPKKGTIGFVKFGTS